MGMPQPAVVLIAEDEAPLAALVAALVELAGHTPLVARNGAEALALARRHPPAVVVTDLMMPGLTGAALIAALRADAATGGYPPPPVILMTASGPTAARAAQADAVLLKPFALAALEGLLQRFLAPRYGLP